MPVPGPPLPVETMTVPVSRTATHESSSPRVEIVGIAALDRRARLSQLNAFDSGERRPKLTDQRAALGGDRAVVTPLDCARASDRISSVRPLRYARLSCSRRAV